MQLVRSFVSGGDMIEVIGLVAVLALGFLVDGLVQSSDDDENQAAEKQADETEAVNKEFAAENGFFLGDKDAGVPKSSDTQSTADSDETLMGGDSADTLFGNRGNDMIYGSTSPDNLGGRAGDDTLFGDFGSDYLTGESGNDSLNGGGDDDTIYGDDGADSLIGGAGADMLYAGRNDDTVMGNDGFDSLFGGEGQDQIWGGEGNDMLDGGQGDDHVFGGTGQDEIFGSEGNDTLWGNEIGQSDTEVDFLNGGAGDDALMLGVGDWGHGGEGADDFIVTDYGTNTDVVQITDFNPADDQLIFIYDSALTQPPTAAVQTDGFGNTQILLDGEVVAILGAGGTIDVQDIILRAG